MMCAKIGDRKIGNSLLYFFMIFLIWWLFGLEIKAPATNHMSPKEINEFVPWFGLLIPTSDTALEGSSGGSRNRMPGLHMEQLDWVIDSKVWPPPAALPPALKRILKGVSQWIGTLFLCLTHFYLSAHQKKKRERKIVFS